MDGLLNKIHLADCMDIMREMPDNYIDLAIVDPPYGIGGGSNVSNKSSREWDKKPIEKYFYELDRISKNQIIWGGNYFTEMIKFNSNHSIIWDKQNGNSFMSDAEIALTTIKKNTTKFFKLFWMSNMMGKEEKPIIHPTQKPVALYRWLLQNYAKPGDLIFDSHSGSGSLAIACVEEGFNYIACEIDPDYHKASVERLHKKYKELEQGLGFIKYKKRSEKDKREMDKLFGD